jgi:hypothetical protein
VLIVDGGTTLIGADFRKKEEKNDEIGKKEEKNDEIGSL